MKLGMFAAVASRLVHLLAALSLLLFVLSTGLWIRSYWKFDSLGWTVGGNESPVSCNSLDGDLEIFLMKLQMNPGNARWTLNWEVHDRKSTQWIANRWLKAA